MAIEIAETQMNILRLQSKCRHSLLHSRCPKPKRPKTGGPKTGGPKTGFVQNPDN